MTDHSPAGRALIRLGATIGAGALGAALLAGCGTPTPTTPPDGGNGSSTPGQTTGPASTPTPTTPARSVTADNLLGLNDIYSDDPMTSEAVEAADGDGRSVSESFICLPTDGLASLGATAMVNRDFTFKILDAKADPNPKSPLKNKPSIYTQALQFPDEAAATAARATYAGWINACPATLTEKGYAIDGGQSIKLSTLKITGAKAQGAMVAYVPPDATDAENLYWESAAVTQVKDRLMLTVALSWGPDTPGTFDDTDGDFVNPLLILSELSAEALAR